MPTRLRPFTKAIALGSLTAWFGLGLFVSRAASEHPLEQRFKAAYLRTPEVSGSFAGVRLDALAIGALRLLEREDRTVEDGGISLIYGDTEPRVAVDLAVARNTHAARAFVDAKLRAVSTQLPPATDPTWGDYAFGDGEAIVIGATRNVAWRVHALAGFKARDAVAALHANLVPGTPAYPTATLALPSDLTRAGGALRVTTSASYTLHAEGGYVTHASVLKPFAPGPVIVIATLTDDLSRVAEVRARTTAK